MKILIVDDEKVILNGLAAMIQKKLKLPFEVDLALASNVPEALEILHSFTPDLLLTDIRMPLMDGFSLMEEVQKKNIPTEIAILTSHADFSYAQRAIKFGVLDFLLKPVETEPLTSLITQVHDKLLLHHSEQISQTLLKIREMLLYDFSQSELLLDQALLKELFPYEYFTVHIIEFSEESFPSRESLETSFKNYYQTCFSFFFNEKRQYIFIGNHAQYRIDMEKLSSDLTFALKKHTSYYHSFSMVSNSIKDLPQLYHNAQQKNLCKKAFGNELNASSVCLFTYQDCIAIFTSKTPSETEQQFLHFYSRLGINQHTSSNDLDLVYKSFLVNLETYLNSLGINDSSVLHRPTHVIHDFNSLDFELRSLIHDVQIQISEDFTNRSANDQMHSLINYIEQNYRYDISLENIAEAVGLHPSYVCALFKKRFGQSFLNILHGYRLKIAKELLIQDRKASIDSIAQQTGYTSSNQFSRVFRKYEHMTPSEYRNRHHL